MLIILISSLLSLFLSFSLDLLGGLGVLAVQSGILQMRGDLRVHLADFIQAGAWRSMSSWLSL